MLSGALFFRMGGGWLSQELKPELDRGIKPVLPFVTEPRYHRHIRAEWETFASEDAKTSALRAVPCALSPSRGAGPVPPQAEEWEWGWRGHPPETLRGLAVGGRHLLLPGILVILLTDPGVWAPPHCQGSAPSARPAALPPLRRQTGQSTAPRCCSPGRSRR